MASFTVRNGDNCPTNEGKIVLAKYCHGRIMQRYQPGQDGAVGQYVAPSGDEPMICIRHRGTLYWAAIDSLSPNKLDVYKKQIVQTLENRLLIEEEQEEAYFDDMNTIGKRYGRFIEIMFNEMTDEQRANCKSNIALQTYLQNHICSGCNTFTNNLSKCIHRDCTGCCANCIKIKCFANKEEVIGTNIDGSPVTFTQMVPICRGCKQEQVMECPICQKEKTPTELCQFACSHVVCWKCFAMSAVHGQQLQKCPMCREEIELKN